ncbi:TonB-linked SusC/RagA family outer membrane protein [Kordia periserrulae]|uniref:TonB-linked SusC/RagA family outer membrane protein n=1 Tax=Kordia periserrulae TaxID=701523 RepID=A0A2T6C094_9FLAO|nr:TonB-dependent receptor [Kordia periserrulae]PTX61734.1 TonB-linked SusC/RagA family outer membrane protein [Kordia periserrulae]
MKHLIYLLLILPMTLVAQELTISGTVNEAETNITLPGVSVYIKGSSKGVTTDFSGKYEIKANKGDVLVFSFIGKQTQEVTVDKSAVINITLQPDVTQLDAVTISTGYFDVNKRDLSGSIAQVTSETLEKNRTQTVEQLLQGQVAGVVVTENGEPGGGISIAIRGTNSFLGGTQPLYIVDGLPVDPLEDAQGNGASGQSQNSLSFLNPNDIEKVEVLKDAAATAVYGARGANGVVLITTKTGGKSDGRDNLTVTIDNFITTTTNKLDVMNGPTFERYMNQRAINQLYVDITNPANNTNPFDGTQDLTIANYPQLDGFTIPFPVSTGVDTDWQDAIYRQAYSRAYNLSYRGGNDKGNFLVSLGLQDTEGVIINTNNRRITLNVNGQRKAFDGKIDIFSKTNIAYNKGNASSVGNGEIFLQRGVVSQALQFQPIFSLLEPGQDDSVYADLNEGTPISNPFTLARDVTDLKESYNFIQNIGVTAKITPKLTGIVRGAFNFQKSSRDIYYPTSTTRGRNNNGEASQATREYRKLYGEVNLRYRNRFGKHRIDAVAIGTVEEARIRTMFNRAFGFGSDAFQFYDLSAATDILPPESRFINSRLLSGIFRLGYNYKRRYYLDLNARVDASSKLAEGNKARFFGSAAFSWRISDEKFLKDSKTISDLKFRLSYGRVGNDAIPPFQSLSLGEAIRYNFNGQITTGIIETNLPNPNLKWEITDQFNAGLDVGLKDNKVRVTVDTYYKLTSDLLQNVILAPSNGFVRIIDNFGEVENYGLEIALNANIINTDTFQWDFGTNFSLNRNNLKSLNSNLDFQLGPNVGFAQTNPILFRTGSPLGIFWGAQTDGIYESWEEANASGIAGAAPGEIRYVNNSVDVDTNGQPLPNQEINFDDYVQIGDPNPDFTIAINNTFKYGNWDLTTLITGQKGGDIFWVDAWPITGNQNSRNGLTSAFEDSWTAPLGVDGNGDVFFDPNLGNTTGVGNPAPLINAGPRAIPSDRNIYDGSFIRLKNVNLGYTFNFKKGTKLRLYITGQNLITITDYPGYDPEVTTFNKDPQRRGVDFGGYPGVQTYSFGLNFNY